jgi:hypothetical protein
VLGHGSGEKGQTPPELVAKDYINYPKRIHILYGDLVEEGREAVTLFRG